jgi:hypothetical protein
MTITITITDHGIGVARDEDREMDVMTWLVLWSLEDLDGLVVEAKRKIRN